MSHLLAQTQHTYSVFSGIGGLSDTGPGFAVPTFVKVVSTIIGLLTLLAGIWFLIQLVISGIQWISSKGDKQGLASVQARMTHAIVGLLVVVLSYAIFSLVGYILGFGNILNLEGLILRLFPAY